MWCIKKHTQLIDIFNTFVKCTNEINVHVSLEDFMQDGLHTFEYKYFEMCPSCNGTGSTDRIDYTCENCNQTGIEHIKRQNFFENVEYDDLCSKCKGRCKIIPSTYICKECDGYGFFPDKIVEYTTEQEMNDCIFVRTFDNPRKKITVKIDKHEYDGPNIVIPCKITADEAKYGFTKDIDLYDRLIHICKESPTHDWDIMISGYKIHNRNITIRFKVKYNDNINIIYNLL